MKSTIHYWVPPFLETLIYLLPIDLGGAKGPGDPGTGSPQHSMESPRLCPLLEDQWAAYMRTVSLGLDSDIPRKPFKLRLFGDEIITKADMVSSDVDLTSIISI